MWTTRIPVDEPEWTPSDEVVDEQELDDFQLARLGIDVPDREWVEPVERPATPVQMEELMNTWTAAMGEEHREVFQRAVESVYNTDTGSLEFGDAPAEEESRWTVLTEDDLPDDDDEEYDDFVDDYYDEDDLF